MEVKAILNNLRTAPRKVRLVADLVRNKSVSQARSLLEFTPQKSSGIILKLLNSAIASAVNDFKHTGDDLYISKITVDEGPTLKRWHPMSRGRAYPIMKRTSHITLVLSDNVASHTPKASKKVAVKKDVESKKKPVNEKVIVKKAVKKEKTRSAGFERESA